MKKQQYPVTTPSKYFQLNPYSPVRSLAAIPSTFLQDIRLFGPVGAFRTCFSTMLLVTNREQPISRADTTLITCSIYPDLSRLWYFFARKFVPGAEIVIVDSSGTVQSKHYPEARVIKFSNFSHARKLDYFLRYELSSRFVWISDDDVMIICPGGDIQAKAIYSKVSNLAAVSFTPRGWSIPVDGLMQQAIGTYSIFIDREIYLREGLSFSPVESDNPSIGRTRGYYDTGDYANEQLLKRGYQVQIISKETPEEQYSIGFVGVSVTRLKLMRQGHDAFLQALEQVAENPGFGVYTICGIYSILKISQLYQEIFREKPVWICPISEDRFYQTINTARPEIRTRVINAIHRYEKVYKLLLMKSRE